MNRKDHSIFLYLNTQRTFFNTTNKTKRQQYHNDKIINLGELSK